MVKSVIRRGSRRLTYGNVMATAAFVLAIGGTGYAAVQVGSAGILNNSVQSADIKNNSLGSVDIRNGSLLKVDFKAGQLAAGAQGPQGPQGPVGPQGPPGGTGATAPVKGITYKVNATQPTTTIFTGVGFRIEASCPSNSGPDVTARSTADNGIASTYAINGPTQTVDEAASDFNFDLNQSIVIHSATNKPNTEGNGVFNFASASGTNTSVSFLYNFGTTQGDCVFTANVSVGN